MYVAFQNKNNQKMQDCSKVKFRQKEQTDKNIFGSKQTDFSSIGF